MIATIQNRFGLILKDLIEMKNSRDSERFTAAKLANKIGINRSILQRILSGEVLSPRLDTVQKICTFFSDDGFPVSMDSIIIENNKHARQKTQQIPLFLSGNSDHSIGLTNIDFSENCLNLVAFVSEDNISSLLKKGSIFIVDTKKTPINDNIIAVGKNAKITFWKYIIDEKNNLITSLKEEKTEKLEISNDASIIGVVIRINAKL